MTHFWYGCDDKRLHSCSRVVTLLFTKSRINDINYAVYRKRCLRDICRQDNLPGKKKFTRVTKPSHRQKKPCVYLVIIFQSQNSQSVSCHGRKNAMQREKNDKMIRIRDHSSVMIYTHRKSDDRKLNVFWNSRLKWKLVTSKIFIRLICTHF